MSRYSLAITARCFQYSIEYFLYVAATTLLANHQCCSLWELSEWHLISSQFWFLMNDSNIKHDSFSNFRMAQMNLKLLQASMSRKMRTPMWVYRWAHHQISIDFDRRSTCFFWQDITKKYVSSDWSNSIEAYNLESHKTAEALVPIRFCSLGPRALTVLHVSPVTGPLLNACAKAMRKRLPESAESFLEHSNSSSLMLESMWCNVFCLAACLLLLCPHNLHHRWIWWGNCDSIYFLTFVVSLQSIHFGWLLHVLHLM